MAAVIERAELHKTIWRIANELLRLFGDVYECLMTVYSSSIGKSGGEFCASLEVSDRLASVALDGLFVLLAHMNLSTLLGCKK